MSFVDERYHHLYSCHICHQIAHNAFVLDCDTQHHSKDSNTLYCSHCVSRLSSPSSSSSLADGAVKCPLNQHDNPSFVPSKHHRAIMQTLEVVCPYAARSKYDANGKITFVYDTDDGHVSSESHHDQSPHLKHQDNDIEGMDHSSSDAEHSSVEKRKNQNGCRWVGAYQHLSHHIDTQCKFVPVKHQLARLRSKTKELEQRLTQAHIEQNARISLYANHQVKFLTLCFLLSAVLLLIGAYFGAQFAVTQYMGHRLSGIEMRCSHCMSAEECSNYIDQRLDAFMGMDQPQATHAQGTGIENDVGITDAKEAQYEMMDEILSNVWTKYNTYKESIDSLPMVQWISNAMHLQEKTKT